MAPGLNLLPHLHRDILVVPTARVFSEAFLAINVCVSFIPIHVLPKQFIAIVPYKLVAVSVFLLKCRLCCSI